jgi:hypothetical protein
MAAYAGIAAGPHFAAPVIAPQALTVVTSNQAAVPGDELERALSIAARIFWLAGARRRVDHARGVCGGGAFGPRRLFGLCSICCPRQIRRGGRAAR